MQTIYPQLYKLKKYVVCLLSFLTIGKGLVCQVITAKPQFHNSMILRKMPMDTSPIRKAIINNHLRINPGISEVFRNTAATDTVISLTPYLKTKSDCDFEKTIDNDGCIIIKYNDGFIKKSCDGNVVEVITPDGKKYVSRFGGYNILMAVLPIPPPPDPLSTDTDYSTQRSTRFHGKGLQDSMGKDYKRSFSKPQDFYPKDKIGAYGFLSAFSLLKSVFF
jgi:hypothetical protein